MRQLSDEAILQIYKEHNWFIFDPDLSRAKAVAQEAQRDTIEQVVEQGLKVIEEARAGVKLPAIEDYLLELKKQAEEGIMKESEE